MKKFFWWLLLSFCCFNISQLQNYNIVPEDRNCSSNGRFLNSCYTLHQLIVNQVLLSATERSLTLLLLPGTHLIQEGQTLEISNFSTVDIRPWNEDAEVILECKQEPAFVFQSISELKIIAVHFATCTLQYLGSDRNYNESVNITKCAFQSSKVNPAVSFRSALSKLNITISYTIFSSNNGAVAIVTPPHDFVKPEIAHLKITDTLFQSNNRSALLGHGGAVHVDHTVLIVSNSQFVGNTASTSSTNGGAISARYSTLSLSNSMFYENHASLHGSAVHLFQSGVYSSGCHFINNSAGQNGAVYIATTNALSSFNGDLFQGNYANGKGGALHISRITSDISISGCQFENNSAYYSGGALYIRNSNVEISASTFRFNNARSGGAIFCNAGIYNSIAIAGGDAVSNLAENEGGFLYLLNCEIFMLYDSIYMISNNRASNGGAIYADTGSSLSIDGSVSVNNNFAEERGGALYLISSVITLQDSALVLFDHNSAADRGGAIFISDMNCEKISREDLCFVNDFYEKLVFVNNSAQQGPILYGGLLDRCCGEAYTLNCHIPRIDFFKNFSLYEPTPLAITSDPVKICLCTLNKPECFTREISIDKATGQAIDLVGVVVDQSSNPKASFIRARYIEPDAQLGRGEGGKETENQCTNLSYHVYTDKSSATLVLQPEGYCEHSVLSSILVHIRIIPCSRGFEKYDRNCVCERRLIDLISNIECDVDTETILRTGSIWLRYDEQYLKVHGNCPLDYCQFSSDSISIAYPDKQCANNRSGIICGACRENHSIALGGTKCLPCTSSYNFIWLIPIFLVAGILLVAFLLVCNMSISHGTLNGIIFYCNIISITGVTSLQNCTINPTLSVFIAWINLDFGVETCFYGGLDRYQKTWLQFVFPLYIWLIVGVIILVSHYSATLVKVIGKNSIAILATLFLLSYAKILKTIATALSFTEVFRGSANDTSSRLMPYKVWMYDGNIEYLKGNHVILFVVALMFLVFLFLPYTLLLTFGQYLRSIPTENKCLVWCLRSTAFTSIMDAYHAPYNNKHRYWTGLMLLTRCVLFIAYAFSSNSNKTLENMYITTVVLAAILALKVFIPQVYKNAPPNKLETCFLLNLLILSATLQYFGGNSSNGNICNYTTASISVSIILFTCILAYHTYLLRNKIVCLKSVRRNLHVKVMQPTVSSVPSNSFQPSTTTVELREQLLESETF